MKQEQEQLHIGNTVIQPTAPNAPSVSTNIVL